MNNMNDKLELLGRAFVYGEFDKLSKLLLDECKYYSDYAHRSFTSSEQILKNMRKVYQAIQDSEKDCSYTYEIIELNTILNDGVKLDDLYGDGFFDVYENGLFLYQFENPAPVAVVFVKLTPGGSISEIHLSRSHKWFSVTFYDDDELEDSEKDIPYTVKPLSRHDKQVKDLQSSWTHQKTKSIEFNDHDVYIWRQADKFFKEWLDGRKYELHETRIFDDCIGYRCSRNNYAYTIYMFAYGQEKTAQLDGDYCKKFLEYDLSKNSTVLVAYLNVKRYMSEKNIEYKVCNYCGDYDEPPELWRINNVNSQWILEYYPRKEMMDATYGLMYAFNRDNMDVFDCIISDNNPVFYGLDGTESFMNDSFYEGLFQLHKKYGNMKIGYVRFNDVIYSFTPYIDGYGFFSLRMDNATNKIQEVTAYPFEGRTHQVEEFIKTEEEGSSDWYANVPEIISVKALPPVDTERFALKLGFNNGECRKYVLPIEKASEHDKKVFYKSNEITDEIWKTAEIAKSDDVHRGIVVRFNNEFFIPSLKCYEESETYSEPMLCEDTLFEDDKIKINRLWKWKVNSIYEDKETGIIKALISRNAFNYGTSTFASREGKRLCSINFDYISNFHDGLARVGKAGHGYGYIDKNMKFVFPMTYDDAEDFIEGKAKVKRGDRWVYIDKAGNETSITPKADVSKYQDVGEYSEGMCKVSTLKLRFMDLAYYSDYEDIAGTWGFINEDGVEVVAPQYIYAEDFAGGIAVVCKGKWTIDKKWDNKYNSGKYWTEDELWGAIDKNGNEVIPFIFDDIKHFWDVDNILMAHIGGWEKGHWGVIDNHGNWLAEPIFEDIDYEYQDGLFAFYSEKNGAEMMHPLGIYDLEQKKVIFEPQFFYVSFRDDGWIVVEEYDEKLGRRIEKIIDREGKEKFHSEYSSIYTWEKPYEVVIRDKHGERHGLVDEDGTVVLPCEYDTAWNGIYPEQKLMIYKNDEKYGIKDFDGNVIVLPKYLEIHGITDPLITVRVGEGKDYKEGLIKKDGTVVIPAEFETINWCQDNYIICCRKGCCEMLHFISKQ